MDIATWLRSLSLERYEPVFRDNEIDAAVLPELTDKHLAELGLPLGPRLKLLKAIAALRTDAPSPAAGTAPPAASPAERRQLTVLFCDLVGSTELSARLDPEDLREVISTYHRCIVEVVHRFEGHVAKYLGDGALVYFGYPRAHEDDAERAVHTGLGLIEAVSGLAPRNKLSLQVRVGIATGQVVVGDLIGEGAPRGEVVGETPNLAHRLQALADPASVVIAPRTRRLVHGLFDLADLGGRWLKGFAAPVQVWQVLGPSQAEGRFDARQWAANLMPMVGRDQELARLLDRWRQASAGDGQCVVLTGEAGIGKSRLARALRDALAEEPLIPIHWQCSPYHSDSALWPAIRQVARAAGLTPADTAAERLDKVEALVSSATEHLAQAIPLIAALLGIDASSRYAPLALTPQQQRAGTLGALVDQLTGLAAKGPVLFLLEDAHWADPTSLELLELILDRIGGARILVLVTARPEFQGSVDRLTRVTRLTLGRLDQAATEGIAGRIARGKSLPAEILRLIVDRTDGVPLYVEELTKAILESGALRETAAAFAVDGAFLNVTVPESLHELLLARLDRLGPAKEVAQLASVVGREFTHELLLSLSGMSADELDEALDRLLAAGLVLRSGLPPNDTYGFKHALVRDAAYATLLHSRRQELHARVAQLLEQRFAEVVESQPELLAHHYTEANLTQKCIPYWQRAGERSARASADREAVAHLKKGLQLVERLPEGRARAEQELAFCLTLGPTLSNIEGSGGAEVGQVYLRARRLGERVGRPEQLFAALWGVWAYHHMSGRLVEAQLAADEVVGLASQLPDSGFLLQAHHAAWTTRHVLGDLSAALQHAERGVSLYDIERHRSHAFVYGGHDPGICARWNMTEITWQLGFPDRALGHAQDLLSLGERLSHPTSLATAQSVMILIRAFRGELESALALAGEMLDYTAEHEVSLWHASASMLRAWILAALGRGSEVIDDFRDAVEQRAARGAMLRQSFYLALLAEAYGQVDRLDQGIDATSEALASVKTTGERRWESMIYRVRATLFARAPRMRPDAEACFAEALEIARAVGARSYELQAALGLAGLWSEEGRMNQARDLLAPVYGWFTEGFDTRDLQDAKTLLDGLRRGG